MSNGLFNSNLSYEAMIFFCRDLSSLLSAGIPLHAALHSISNESVGEFANVLRSIEHAVSNGSTLSEAMGNNGKFFTSIFVSTIRVAETSGELDTQLAKLAIQMEREKKMEDGITEMIVYPKILIYVCFAMLLINLLLMIPLVKSFLPASFKFDSGFLKIFVNTSDILYKNWKATLVVLISSIAVFEILISSRKAKIFLMGLFAILPGFSDVIKNDSISRYLRGIALLIEIGIPIIQAVKMAGEMSGNDDVDMMSRKIAYVLEQGHTVSDAFYNSNYFNSSIVSMVENAERTGNYSTMFEQASIFYEDKAKTKLSKVMAIMKPLITIVMAVVIFANIGMLIYPIIKVAMKAVH